MGDKHYVSSEENLKRFGQHTLDEYKDKGLDPIKKFGTNDALEMGKLIKKWNVELITRGPVLAMVWQGPDAVEIVRKLAGDTRPKTAVPGTIRGDFSWDNYKIANDELRSVYNILHASGTPEEAEYEINLWFSKDEIFDKYELYAHRAMHKRQSLANK
jgi:nucleoside-diphosphate kinase